MDNLELFAAIMLIAKNDGEAYRNLRDGNISPEDAAWNAEQAYRRHRAALLRDECRELRPAIAEALKTWAKEGGER